MKQKSNIIIKSLFALILCLLMTACSINIEIHNANKPSNSDNSLAVHYLSVGQGDSIFVELPDKKTMLIDAGVNGLGEGIQEYINKLGYTTIDFLVATHPHSDHIGSMDYIVKNFNIGSIYMPKVSTTTKTYERLLTAVSDKGYKIKSTSAGMTIGDSTDYTIDVLGPVTIDKDELNNCSIVLKITYMNNKFLFLGDAEKQEINSITADMSSNVLKVGHHGSTTSTNETILEKISPQYAVISVGRDNDYGHPSEKTLSLLEDFNCKTYRTDTDETIIITSDGSNIEVTTDNTDIKGVK